MPCCMTEMVTTGASHVMANAFTLSGLQRREAAFGLAVWRQAIRQNWQLRGQLASRQALRGHLNVRLPQRYRYRTT